VPPGRLIPTKQMWGGNPCVFIKDLNIGETWSNYTLSYLNHAMGEAHKHEFTLWNSAYLHKESYADDLNPPENELDGQRLSNDLMRGMVKHYA